MTNKIITYLSYSSSGIRGIMIKILFLNIKARLLVFPILFGLRILLVCIPHESNQTALILTVHFELESLIHEYLFVN